jgi:antirestriction protein ArdC
MKAYEVITERIITKMEQGQIPWKKPWKFQAPRNFVSRRQYQGINLLLLTMSEFGSPYWLTFRQAKELGGYIKSSEHGTPVIFWKLIERVEENTKEGEKTVKRYLPCLQYYTVFNLDQTEGVKYSEDLETEIESLTLCKQIVQGYTAMPEILHTTQPKAFYSPSRDIIHMPAKSSFMSSGEYYSTLFHEFIHSTGHKNRLDRHADENTNFDFGSHDYSKEELVAELGSAFLCAEARIDNSVIDNNAAYLQSWLRVLKADKKLIIYSAARASKAADYILGRLE